MIDRMKLIIEIPNELHKKLKMKALTNDTTLKDMILPSLEKLAIEKDIDDTLKNHN